MQQSQCFGEGEGMEGEGKGKEKEKEREGEGVLLRLYVEFVGISDIVWDCTAIVSYVGVGNVYVPQRPDVAKLSDG